SGRRARNRSDRVRGQSWRAIFGRENIQSARQRTARPPPIDNCQDVDREHVGAERVIDARGDSPVAFEHLVERTPRLELEEGLEHWPRTTGVEVSGQALAPGRSGAGGVADSAEPATSIADFLAIYRKAVDRGMIERVHSAASSYRE